MLKFAYSTKHLLSTWKATLDSGWSGVILVTQMQLLLKQYFIEGVASLFGSYSLPPMSHVVSFFWSIPHPRKWVTYFLNGPTWEFIASKVVIYSFRNRGHHVFMLLIDCQLLNLLSLAHAIIHQVNSTVRRRLKTGS